MEGLVKYIVQQYGVGTLLGLATGWLAYRLWNRNNELQDARISDVQRIASNQDAILREVRELAEHVSTLDARLTRYMYDSHNKDKNDND